MAVTSPHLDPRWLALVFAGGAVGATMRAALGSLAAAQPGGWPWGTFIANVTGALALGFLTELLLRRVRDERRRQALQLTFGTGLLGGYTTYSSFAVETVALLGAAPWLGVAYGATTVIAGFAAAAGGWWLASRIEWASR